MLKTIIGKLERKKKTKTTTTTTTTTLKPVFFFSLEAKKAHTKP